MLPPTPPSPPTPPTPPTPPARSAERISPFAGEFNALIRRELDIESLLRTTLEFVLAKGGPTNAAVFLPTTSGDYTLGAYVNYDCPKEAADVLLDHLANAVAPKFEGQTELLHLTRRSDVDRAVGAEAGWMADSHIVVFACHHDNECLAIFLLFRDRGTPFAPAIIDGLRAMSGLFASQLAKVVRIHHRHVPKHKWGAIGDFDEGADDIGGMAA